jgi:mannose-6-phosphate isomerase-like protein (cupin superfamily)
MVTKGEVITNPVSGERYTLVDTTDDTAGRFLRFAYALPAGDSGPPRHVHAVTEERFTVTSGRLGLAIGPRTDRQFIEAGQTITLPPRVPHRLWNAGAEELQAVCELRPPGQILASMDTLVALMRDGEITKRGMPTNVWRLAILTQQAEAYLPGVPIRLQEVIFGRLASAARRLGY